MGVVWPYIECFSTILLACELLFCVPMLELRRGKAFMLLASAAFLVVFNSRFINNIVGAESAEGVTHWIISRNTIALLAAYVALS